MTAELLPYVPDKYKRARLMRRDAAKIIKTATETNLSNTYKIAAEMITKAEMKVSEPV